MNYIKLERVKLGFVQNITADLADYFAEPPRINITYDGISEQISLSVIQYVYGENIRHIKYPADWWQAFKERWFPAWALALWPVRFVEIDIKALYPKIKVPNQSYVIQAVGDMSYMGKSHPPRTKENHNKDKGC